MPDWPWLVAAHAVGLLAVHALVRAHSRYPGQRWLDLLRHFYPVLLYTSLFCETSHINLMFAGRYLDPEFIQLEEWVFGFQPSLWFMKKLPFLAVSELFYAAYFSYYLMIAGVSLALFWQNRSHFFHFLTVTTLLFYGCYLIYVFLPVIGPQVFFVNFPGYPSPPPWPVQPVAAFTPKFPEAITAGPFFHILKVVYFKFGSTGAAFPSSHVAVAVCTLYFSRRYLPRWRWIHGTFVVLLCFATVYCRYHYVVDVLAGLTMAAVFIPLGNWLYKKSL